MSQDTEVDMKEVELNELEPEKQPMNAAAGAAAGEKNGLVKIKVAEDEAEAGTKFTGLSKEELLKVAGSPGWVRTRWALLLLFWLGWLGMLAGAVVIIVRAPRCRELPVQRWWHEGALYRVGDLQAFVGPNAGGIAGEWGGGGHTVIPFPLCLSFNRAIYCPPPYSSLSLDDLRCSPLLRFLGPLPDNHSFLSFQKTKHPRPPKPATSTSS